MSAVRSFQRSALKRALGIRTYATEPTLKARLAEILPEKAEEVKQLKKEYGKTVCINFPEVEVDIPIGM
ncbi:CIC11C00000001881 [Sungouiella intermedia]|uniref:CIC11C00000001881 n=1 Tax=Sungouiella intermedia TaxID=45354 RepID=A0A1L0BTH1_9ASCO|nr:CIC11C00000001881 [[Candida] intermedia]